MPTKVATANLKRGMSWSAVKNALLKIIKGEPSAIGLQEIYGQRGPQVKAFLAQHGYNVVIQNDVPIAYDSTKYKLVDSGSARLPGKPDGARNPARYANYVVLADRKSGQQVVFTNTHLNHGTPNIQRNQIAVLGNLQRSLAKRYSGADFFLVGDMNNGNGKQLTRALKGTGLRGAGNGVDWVFSNSKVSLNGLIRTGSDHATVVATANTKGGVSKPVAKVSNFSKLNTAQEKNLLAQFAKNQGLKPNQLGEIEHRLNTLRAQGKLGDTGRALYYSAMGWNELAQKTLANRDATTKKKNASTASVSGFKGTQDQSAYTVLSNYFQSLGMQVTGDLSKIIKEMMTGGYTPDQINLFMPEIEKTQAFQARFPGYTQRIKNGYSALSLGDYLSLEDQYHQILQQNGLPAGFYDDPSDFGNWIANNVSPDEIQTRVTDATSLAQQIDPTMRNIMGQFYGLTTGDIASYFLDPSRALPTLTRQYNASGIAAAAQRAGLAVSSMNGFEDLVDRGVSVDQANAGYGTVAALTNSVGELASIYGDSYTQADAENDVFFNDSSKRQNIVNKEQATFGGQGRAGNTGSSNRQAY